MIKKLKSRSGESIAETLVAVLIAALALLMLAGTINSSSNMITKSSSALDAYYQANNAVENRTDSAGSSTVTVSDGGTAWITCSADIYENDELGSTPVTAYHVTIQDEE